MKYKPESMDTPQREEHCQVSITEPRQSSDAVQLSVVACQRCRNQKLKCSRERPLCSRCRRLQAICVYPLPVKRRGRKPQRNCRETCTAVDQSCLDLPQPQTDIVNLTGESTRCVPALNLSDHIVHQTVLPDGVVLSPDEGSREAERAASSSRAAPAFPERHTGTRTPYIANGRELIHPTPRSNEARERTRSTRHGIPPYSDDPPLPPRALGLGLLEIYFSRIYNASLLFQKHVVFHEYLKGDLPTILVKAMFALATLFLDPDRQHENTTSLEGSELDVLQCYGSCGLAWAKSAVREATSSAIEQPSLVTTQALECLQLYWFGIGNFQSCSLCLSLAYRSCHLLGYNRGLNDGCNDLDLSLESELNRRCFWACWISTCISMEPESCIRAAWKEVAMVPLPAYIQDSGSRHDIILREKMNQDWESRPVELNMRHHFTPAAAFLVKIMGVWAKAQLLVNDWNASSPSLNVKSVYSLSDLATSVFNSASSVTDPMTVNDIESESHSMKLLAESLFHQCQIILHSMLVPLFSGALTGPEMDMESVKRSAEKVIRHAGLHEKLLSPFLYGSGDITVLPPLVGYGAFIAGIVLLATETPCQDKRSHATITESRTESRRLRAVRAILRLLNVLCRHWRTLSHLPEQLSSALDRQLHSLKSQESSTERNRMYGIDRMQSLNDATHLVDVAQESPGPSTLAPHLETMDHSIYQANNPRGDSRSSLALTQTCSGVGEADSVDPEELLMEPPGVPLDDSWYNMSIGDAYLEEPSGFEPLALFQHGWRVFN